MAPTSILIDKLCSKVAESVHYSHTSEQRLHRFAGKGRILPQHYPNRISVETRAVNGEESPLVGDGLLLLVFTNWVWSEVLWKWCWCCRGIWDDRDRKHREECTLANGEGRYAGAPIHGLWNWINSNEALRRRW